MAKKVSTMEKGILKSSCRYFFTPTDSIQNMYFNLSWCGHYYCDSNYVIDRIHYPYLLYLQVIKGHLNLYYHSKDYLIKKGQAILIDCRAQHRYTGSEGLEFIFYNFSGSNAFTIYSNIVLQNGYIFENEQARMTAIISQELLEKLDIKTPLSFPYISQNIHQILMILSEPKEDYAKTSNEPNNPIDSSVDFIKKNFQDPSIRLESIAKQAKLSKFYFSRLFKRKFLCSPKEYILNLRIEQAKYLLKSTTKSIDFIALEIGYENIGSFTNYFTKKVGLSPSKFRNTSI